MAMQLDATQRSLIKILLAQGFENQLIASKPSSIRTRRYRAEASIPRINRQ
ncbi:hypothetical protein CH063_08117 [Colletotrichum higginsianum]|uniref:Uncharacterized protein n=1 Tax=Colletotrichum higginsianum (strain IMI 349063) TaxID=759273 RepID=H1V8M5_COLHI|nr:hypothetical protein CH063_08117 [Colletotrichum higginsianum]